MRKERGELKNNITNSTQFNPVLPPGSSEITYVQVVVYHAAAWASCSYRQNSPPTRSVNSESDPRGEVTHGRGDRFLGGMQL